MLTPERWISSAGECLVWIKGKEPGSRPLSVFERVELSGAA